MKFLKSLIAVIAIVVANAAQLKNRNLANPPTAAPREDSCKGAKLEDCDKTDGCHLSDDKKSCKKSVCRMATNDGDCKLKSTATHQCEWKADKCSKKKTLFTEVVPATPEVIEARKLKCAPSFNNQDDCKKLIKECQWRKSFNAGKPDAKPVDKEDKCRVNRQA
jgi:hypothetical protein